MATLELLDAGSVWSDQNYISASCRNQCSFNSAVQIEHLLENGREVKSERSETGITGSPEKYMFKHVNMIFFVSSREDCLETTVCRKEILDTKYESF